jgi:hypothetical protein
MAAAMIDRDKLYFRLSLIWLAIVASAIIFMVMQ